MSRQQPRWVITQRIEDKSNDSLGKVSIGDGRVVVDVFDGPGEQDEGAHANGADNGEDGVGDAAGGVVDDVALEVQKHKQIAPEEAALEEGPEDATVAGHVLLARAQCQVVALGGPDEGGADADDDGHDVEKPVDGQDEVGDEQAEDGQQNEDVSVCN